MSALIRNPYIRGTTTAAAAARTRTVRRLCQQRQLQGRRNRQRQQLHQPLTTAAKCASWRYVLTSHWCRVDMRGSVNLVLWACQIWMWDALFVVRIWFMAPPTTYVTSNNHHLISIHNTWSLAYVIIRSLTTHTHYICLISMHLVAFYSYKCKKLNSLKQCLTATRPTSHN